MTALTKYQRLETTGIWKPGEDAQRRDVIVSFGNATLVLSNSAEQPLTHWSLAAVERLNPGEHPALFAPDPDGSETLEIEDSDMIEAIGQVRRAIARSRPRPGRLRTVAIAGVSLSILLLSLFWLPGALTRYAASIVPEAKREDVGEQLLERLVRLSGAPCDATYGVKALNRLREKVLGPDDKLVVLPGGVRGTAHLPGGFIVMNRAIVEDPEDPAVTAGYLLAEVERRAGKDPMEALLDTAGLRATLHLMTTGDIAPEVLDAYAEGLLTAPVAEVPAEALLARFEARQIPSTPYAYDVDLSGETTLPLIEADPMRGAAVRPVLKDGQWISLQAICGE
ncbi:hypothetical protein PSA7680_03350 [Pseudoruegeria aquimaris]|uniref:Uncharacterized protein n=1 Tax=Pseudoruegeria aquimaris TaxID=393663 RepID=A0A1Y5TG65_9RHOB|nr:hypothetical protein [Pseudoruegeria aquimaris]SLN63476.1 hypothetical protein PSA7680_03350 [Pseudoruegeria aquimaris]